MQIANKKLLILVVSIITGLAIIVTAVLATVLPKLNSFTSSNKNAVTINEIWDGSKFNSANVNTLLATLSNNSNGTIDTISSNIDSSSGDVITAAQIRNYTTNKTSGQSVIVTFGGFEWIVTYLSKDKEGNVVATLWLSGEDTLDKSTFGNSDEFYGTNNPSSGVPTNMYGTSYIRAKLNNGGRYINITSNSSNPTSVDQTYSPVSDYKFADFVQGGVLTQYMVTPEHISWQENGQSAKDTLGASYNYSNENWTDTKTGATDDSNFYDSGAYNYAGKTFSGYGNDTWKGDYLWLPSMTETGHSDSRPGMWDLSVAERSNGTTSSWSRSAGYNNSYYAPLLNLYGGNYNYYYVNYAYAVRPALHLNLSAVAKAAGLLPTVIELWNSDTETFNLDNVQSLLNVLSNNTNGSIATISQNIDSSGGAINAAIIREYATGKENGETVTVNLGGFKWQVVYLSKAQNNADDPSDDVAGDVIVTLWLSGDEELDASMFGYTENNTYGTGDPNSGVPTNMYGTSYIRAKLNNGGNYIEITSNGSNPTSISGSYSPVSNYKFADFVQDGVLTEYMVTPANISWQESGQSAKTTLSWTYNLSNENWSRDTLDTGFYSSGYNYAHKEYSDTWKDDYLWLPSMTETGRNDSTPGMWSLSVAERSNGTTSSWSRSAYGAISSFAYGLNSSGDNASYSNVHVSRAVRPALHLNLTSVYDALPRNTITLNYDSSQGTVTGAGEYFTGDNVTLTATPNPNYRFVSWTNSAGEVLSTDPEYTFEVTDDMTITANFELITYNVTINVNDTNLGQVLYNNQLNTTITVNDVVINTNLNNFYAITKANSAFLCWQITTASGTTYNYDNPPSIPITEDTTITAVFTSSLMDGIGVVADGGGQVRMGGYNLDNVDSTTQVTLNALAYTDYTFDGWYTMENGALTKIDALGNFTAVTINVADYDGKLIIARFVPNNNGNVNDDVNN